MEIRPPNFVWRSDWPGHKCLHGGPRPSDAGPFVPQLGLCLKLIGDQIDALTMALSAGTEGDTALLQMQVEMQTLHLYWMHPARRAMLFPEACLVCFSCAVDAAYDGRFKIARQYLRVGIFLRTLFDDNGQPYADPFPVEAFEASGSDRIREHNLILRRTRTDRGLVLFLNSFISCGCLNELADAWKEEVRAGKCDSCRRQLPKSQLKRCSRCHEAEYCSVACQRAGWHLHRAACKAHMAKPAPISNNAAQAATASTHVNLTTSKPAIEGAGSGTDWPA